MDDLKEPIPFCERFNMHYEDDKGICLTCKTTEAERERRAVKGMKRSFTISGENVPPCPSCSAKDARIAEMEAKLDRMELAILIHCEMPEECSWESAFEMADTVISREKGAKGKEEK